MKVLRSSARRSSNEQPAPGNQLLLEVGDVYSEEENRDLDPADVEHSDYESEHPYEADIEHFFSESEDSYEADNEHSDQENGDLQEMVVQHPPPKMLGEAVVQQTYTYSVQYS